MITSTRHPQTGLPIVEETRVQGGTLKALPKWASALATPSLDAEKPWFPLYLTWTQSTLTSIQCWKCGGELYGWKPVIDPYGNLVERDGKRCLWFRKLDHATSSTVRVRFGCLNQLAQFDAIRCKDCAVSKADLPMLAAIFLSGHQQVNDHGWDHRRQMAMNRHGWATYLYRWSDATGINFEPIGINISMQPKDPILHLQTPGHPVMPLDYINWTEHLQAGRFVSGMVMEYRGIEPPPGWKVGPRDGTIEKI